MEKLTLDNQNLQEVIDALSRVIDSGGVVCYPTDTSYGLTCNALDQVAVKKIYKIKQMASSKPITLLVRDRVMAEKYGYISLNLTKIPDQARDSAKNASELIDKHWPGALTVIVQKTDKVPDLVVGGSDKVGMRIAMCDISKVLCERFDFPLTTTSANITTQPTLWEFEDVWNSFADQKFQPDLVIERFLAKHGDSNDEILGTGPENDSKDQTVQVRNRPSTIVDCTGEELVIVRQGEVKI